MLEFVDLSGNECIQGNFTDKKMIAEELTKKLDEKCKFNEPIVTTANPLQPNPTSSSSSPRFPFLTVLFSVVARNFV